MKKYELIMHVGYQKNGSTALQKSFVENRKNLISRGIYYGEYFNYNHHNFYHELVYDAFKNYLGVQYRESLPSKYSKAYKCKESIEMLVTRMVKNLKKNRCKKLLISFEYLIGILEKNFYNFTDEKINDEKQSHAYLYFMNRIKELFSDFDIKIICYVRRQDLYLESLFNELIKGVHCEVFYGQLKESDISWLIEKYSFLNIDGKDLLNKFVLSQLGGGGAAKLL